MDAESDDNRHVIVIAKGYIVMLRDIIVPVPVAAATTAGR
jgi:hypothetical protein